MDKLYEALKTIKEHCASQGKTCKGCPLNTASDNSACNIFDDPPEEWDIEQFNHKDKEE